MSHFIFYDWIVFFSFVFSLHTITLYSRRYEFLSLFGDNNLSFLLIENSRILDFYTLRPSSDHRPSVVYVNPFDFLLPFVFFGLLCSPIMLCNKTSLNKEIVLRGNGQLLTFNMTFYRTNLWPINLDSFSSLFFSSLLFISLKVRVT